MGTLVIVVGMALLSLLGATVLSAQRRGPKAIPEDPPPSGLLLAAKRRFIAEMNRRIFREPEISPQLQTLRDMVVGWYELKGPVVGVRFVARHCCEVCHRLDGQQVGLLDVSYLVRHVPPIHREHGRQKDCSCTLQPVTVARGRRVHEKGAVRSSRPLLR